MMRIQAGRVALLLSPMLLVAACSTLSGQARTTQVLDDRLEARLTPDIAAGRVTLERLPDGARVTLVEQSLFPVGGTDLTDNGRDVLTRVVQALVEPSLVRIEVAQSPATPAGLPDSRVQSVTRFFTDVGLAAVLQPSAPDQATPPVSTDTTPPGLTITVSTIAS
jgi:hypothetical protein